MPPRVVPKASQVDPSRSQEATFSILNFDQVLGSILAPFWVPQSLPLGALFATKIAHRMDPTSTWFTSRSTSAPRSPKTPPRAPQDVPRAPKKAPRRPKMFPRGPEDCPKTPQNDPKRPHVLPRTSKNSAAGTRERDRRTCFLVCLPER